MSHRIIWQVKCGTGSDHCFVLVVAKSHWVFCMAIPKSRCCARGKFNRSMTTAKRSTSFMTIIVMCQMCNSMMCSYLSGSCARRCCCGHDKKTCTVFFDDVAGTEPACDGSGDPAFSQSNPSVVSYQTRYFEGKIPTTEQNMKAPLMAFVLGSPLD